MNIGSTKLLYTDRNAVVNFGKMKLGVLVCTLMVSIPTAILAQDADVDAFDAYMLQVPLDWMPAIHAAVTDYSREHPPLPNCVTIKVRLAEPDLVVDFFPKRGPGEEHLRGGVTRCGVGVTYVMNLKGDVVRTMYWR